VLEGNMLLEIKRPDVNKSKAAMDFIKKERFDFILAIGDHWTDEQTFKALPRSAFSVRVGYKYTQAKYSVHSYREVKDLLQRLINVKTLRLETA
jgi:trehalose 6-phosphate synthase/phosphatase